MDYSLMQPATLKAKVESGDVNAKAELASRYMYSLDSDGSSGYYALRKKLSSISEDWDNDQHAYICTDLDEFDLMYGYLVDAADDRNCPNKELAQFYLGDIALRGVICYIEQDKSYFYEQVPDFRRALEWFDKSGYSSASSAQYKSALMYLEGKGTTVNYEKAWELSLNFINQKMLNAYEMLVMSYMQYMYHRDGIGCKISFSDIYYWALFCNALSNNIISKEEISHIESQIELDEIKRLQAMANKDFTSFPRICTTCFPRHYKPFFELEKEVATMINKKPIKHNPTCDVSTVSENGSSKAEEDNSEAVSDKLKSWEIKNVSHLQIWLNVAEENVNFKYDQSSVRLTQSKFVSLFSKCELSLLEEHGKHLLDNNEKPVDYNGTYIASIHNATRRNHQIVSDFNSHFRKLFSLDKSVKAFVWLPGINGKPNTKTLKANFKLHLNYNTK